MKILITQYFTVYTVFSPFDVMPGPSDPANISLPQQVGLQFVNDSLFRLFCEMICNLIASFNSSGEWRAISVQDISSEL